MNSIASEIKIIRDKLLPNVSLLAVSKTRPASMVEEAYKCGQRDFGENKVQDLLEKSQSLSDLDDISWHFIGHLQSNKINQLLQVVNLASIHSIDTSKLLFKILSKKTTKNIGLFLQVNTSGEAQKGGFSGDLDELQEAVLATRQSECFYLQGLMTIGKIRTESFEADARASFSKLVEIRDDLGLPNLQLSMGMSSDFEIAQEYGTNWVRIGSQIFGSRTSTG